jgi:hypothetical protein
VEEDNAFCQDDPTFKFRDDPDKDCDWVAMRHVVWD